MLGLSNVPADRAGRALVESRRPGLRRVFYSDSGATAAEIALKMAFQYHQQRGDTARTRVRRASREAYHGDTIGAVSVGGIDLFHATTARCCSRRIAAEPGDAGHDEQPARAAHEARSPR